MADTSTHSDAAVEQDVSTDAPVAVNGALMPQVDEQVPGTVVTKGSKADFTRREEQFFGSGEFTFGQLPSIFGTDSKAVRIEARPANFDAKLPSVAVLDEFTQDSLKLSATDSISHGELSARAIDEQGFLNVFRLQTDFLQEDSQGSDRHGSAAQNEGEIADSFEALVKLVESGELPLGKGDGVLASFGNASDPTFAEATAKFGISVSAENLRTVRQDLLARLKEVSADATHPESQWAANILRVNAAIETLQSRGINVIHAAGNGGPDKFSPGFLSANLQLTATDQHGKPLPNSADHSLTTKALGKFSVEVDRTTGALELTSSAMPHPLTILPNPTAKFNERSEEGRTGTVTGTSFAHITLWTLNRQIMSAVKEGRTLGPV